MFARKICSTKRNRRLVLALGLLGSSFAILTVPPTLHVWARVLGVTDDVAMIAISIIYLPLVVAMLFKLRRAKP